MQHVVVTNKSAPRLCVVGPMVGRTPGKVTVQGQVLSDLLGRSGYDVVSVSSRQNRYVRLADIVTTLIRRRSEFDVVIIEIYSGRSFVVEDIASLLSKRFGKRIVMWLHGGGLPEFMARYPAWTRRVLSRADMLVAPSRFLADAVVPHGFRARVIPNVIELAEYPFRLRDQVGPRLFWMRNFHPIWNPAMAVRVLARLKETHPAANLVMAGPDRGARKDAENLARELNVQDSVRFAGFLDMDGKKREAEAADIYLNTNLIDNMPVAVVEACAMGLAVVTTAVGGIPDLITHGETGLLVPVNDDEAMVRAILCLLENPEMAVRLSRNGRRLAEQSGWESVRPKWEEAFSELVEEPREIGSPAVPTRAGRSYLD